MARRYRHPLCCQKSVRLFVPLAIFQKKEKKWTRRRGKMVESGEPNTANNTISPSSASACIAHSSDINGDSNFPQGCQFSPDGLCVLTCTRADHVVRLYNTPPLTPQPTPGEEGKEEGETNIIHFPAVPSWSSILKFQAGDSIRSYDWYPQMNSYDPSSCAFIASSR